MRELLKKDSEPRVAGYASQRGGADSFIEQSTLSNNLSLKMGTSMPRNQNTKKLGIQFQFQDQDSSSTQSTCSYPEVASAGDSYQYDENKFSVQSGHRTHEEGSVGSALPMVTQDYAVASHGDHRNPYACFPVMYPDSYYRGMHATYGPQTMLPHPHGMNIMSARVPLPLDYAQDEPIYVNAKQYNAILRRRQYRAKLEAQNKPSKPRKPYLHESRHAHALKRARGPGGRFLNLKKTQETQPGGLINAQDAKNHQGGGTCSDTTSASNGDNFIHQQEHRFSTCGGPNNGVTHHMFRFQ